MSWTAFIIVTLIGVGLVAWGYHGVMAICRDLEDLERGLQDPEDKELW